MDINLNSILKKAEAEANLTGNFDNYISLLLSLEPYGYEIQELREICKYRVDESSLEEYRKFDKDKEYMVEIKFHFHYEDYILFEREFYVSTKIREASCYHIQSIFNVNNSNSFFLKERIRLGRFNKYDFLSVLKIVNDSIKAKYPEIKIKYYEIESKHFSSIDEVINKNL